jgi:TatA/E family protein of Tat protein translocase
MLGFLNNIGPTEWAVIALIVLLFFGSKVATKLGKTSGETLKEMKNIKKTFTQALEDDPNPPLAEKSK